MQTNLPHISVVTPVYGCKTCLAELYLRLKSTLEQINPEFEIILVNDASPDGAWETIVELAQRDTRVKGINLSRNFGQHYAITAGLDHAKGEWVVVMDCDLQDQPEEIVKLYNKALEGWDIVLAQRTIRKDKFFKRLSSKLFHAVYRYLSGIQSDESVANFGVYHKRVIAECVRMKDQARAFGTLLQYVGFRSCAVPVAHAQRYQGASSYSLKKLIQLALDVIIVNSNKPLRLTSQLGFIISIFSFMLALYNVLAHILGIIQVPGFTTTIFSIWFVGGLLLFVLGIIGIYIGKIYDQVKGRQLYVVREVINTEL